MQVEHLFFRLEPDRYDVKTARVLPKESGIDLKQVIAMGISVPIKGQ